MVSGRETRVRTLGRGLKWWGREKGLENDRPGSPAICKNQLEENLDP